MGSLPPFLTFGTTQVCSPSPSPLSLLSYSIHIKKYIAQFHRAFLPLLSLHPPSPLYSLLYLVMDPNFNVLLGDYKDSDVCQGNKLNGHKRDKVNKKVIAIVVPIVVVGIALAAVAVLLYPRYFPPFLLLSPASFPSSPLTYPHSLYPLLRGGISSYISFSSFSSFYFVSFCFFVFLFFYLLLFCVGWLRGEH